jgi:hypothetical protein
VPYHIKFHKDWFKYSKAIMSGFTHTQDTQPQKHIDTQTQTKWRLHKPVLIFQNEESRLKIWCEDVNRIQLAQDKAE